MKVKLKVKDPTLPHQLILGKGRTTNETAVSCNCRQLPHGAFRPFAHVLNDMEGLIELIKEHYNEPKNHERNGVLFTPGADWAEIIEVEV